MTRSKFKPVYVTIKGDNIEDERIFTSPRKLTSYLKMVKEHYSDSHYTITKVNINPAIIN